MDKDSIMSKKHPRKEGREDSKMLRKKERKRGTMAPCKF